MNIDKEKIAEAKRKIGAERTWEIMKEKFGLAKSNDRDMKACCPRHAEDTPSFIFNTKTMSAHCFGCNCNADIIDAYKEDGKTYMQALQELFAEAKMKINFAELGVKTKREYKYPHLEDCGDKTKISEYLSLRKISRKTIDNAGITQDAEGNICFNYYDSNDVLTMVKKRPSRKVAHGEAKNWCQKDSDTTPLLFNMNKVNIEQPLVITEGEIDCLSAIEAGYQNTVSIPLGAGNTHWIEQNWDWLEQFDNIIICFDNDEAGVKARKEVVPRLGAWRTKYIEIPHSVTTADGKEHSTKDFNEILFWSGKQAVTDLIASAKDPGVPSVVDVSDVQDMDMDDMDGILTGVTALDTEIMRLFYGTLTVVSGTPGAGKTSFLAQLACQSLEQNKPVWMFSREMPGWLEKSWLTSIMAGPYNIEVKTLQNGTEYYKTSSEAREKIAEHYKSEWFLYRDDFSNKLEDLLVSMEDSVRKYGVKLLILDNLMTIDLGANENSRLIKETECINELIKFAMKYSVAIILVAHPRKMQSGEDIGIYDVAGSSNIVNLAHRTIGLRRINHEKEKNIHDVALTIIKDRMRGRAGKTFEMFYDNKSRRFYSNEQEYKYCYKWDTETHEDIPYPHHEEDDVFGSGPC